MQATSVAMSKVQNDPAAVSAERLSIVVPCYNEEAVLQETVSRLKAAGAGLPDLDIEMIFVDDGSNDRTRQLLKEHASTDSRVKVIGLARNFGHQVAVTAGLDAASGHAVVVIDADLQDPPELIQQMVQKWREGYDVVYGARTEREGESAFKRATGKFYHRLLNRIAEVPIPLEAGDFRLMSRYVVDTLRAMPERARFLRGLVSWVGLRQISLPYNRAKRFAGESHYPLVKMIRFATDGMFSFSISPLQISVGLGLICGLLSILGVFYVLFVRVFAHANVEGWAGIIIAMLFLASFQFLTTGILGEYVGRIYNEVKRRPLYVVEEYCGYGDRHPTMSRSPVNVNLKPCARC